MSEEKTFGVNWKYVLLISTPIAIAGVASYFIYTKYSKSNSLVSQSSEVAVDEDDPLRLATHYKDLGNKNYRLQRYSHALANYSKAIETCPPDLHIDLAIYYQNRSAAYYNMGEIDKALDDCNTALTLNPRYVKARSRRGKILEDRKFYRQALEDSTAVCLLEGFNNDENIRRADRTMKELGNQIFAEMLMERKMAAESVGLEPNLVLPNNQFIEDIFKSFECDPLTMKGDLDYLNTKNDNIEETKLDNSDENQKAYSNGVCEWVQTLKNAISELRLSNYNECLRLSSLALKAYQKYSLAEKNSDKENHVVSDQHQVDIAMLHLLRGTISYIAFDSEGALEHLQAVVDLRGDPSKPINDKMRPILVNGFIKLALTYQDLNPPNFDKCAALLNSAMRIDPKCVDVYNHRGQSNILVNPPDSSDPAFDLVLEDFNKACQLSPSNPIHKGFKHYTKVFSSLRSMDLQGAKTELSKWDSLIEKNPNCVEIISMQAQILLELGEFDKAIDRLKQTVDISRTASFLVQLAMAMLRRDTARSTNPNSVSKEVLEMLREAIRIEPRSFTAHETLATVLNQKGDLDGALRHYDLACRLPNWPKMICNYLSLRESVRAQITIMSQAGISHEEMCRLRELAMLTMMQSSQQAQMQQQQMMGAEYSTMGQVAGPSFLGMGSGDYPA